MLAFEGFITACLALTALQGLWSLAALRRLRTRAAPSGAPFVSVLVPARNEERALERCVRSLLAQTYPAFEVLVLDDQSEDRTREIAERLAARDGRLRVLAGTPVPAGWIGKCHACAQLAAAARGELLLFTDADTEHRPASVSAAVAALQESGVDLLSIVTRLEMETFAERLLLPIIPFMILAFLPCALAERARHPWFAVGNGQFMLFRRSSYEAAGGHAAVAGDLVEDMSLARHLKARGFEVALRDGQDLVSCRMYHGFRELWEGFTKNLFAAANYSLAAVSALMGFFLAAYVWPWVALAVGVGMGRDPVAWIAVPALEIALAVGLRLAIAWRLRLGVGSCFGHGLAAAAFVGMMAHSLYLLKWGRGASWKGRRYALATGRPGLDLRV